MFANDLLDSECTNEFIVVVIHDRLHDEYMPKFSESLQRWIRAFLDNISQIQISKSRRGERVQESSVDRRVPNAQD